MWFICFTNGLTWGQRCGATLQVTRSGSLTEAASFQLLSVLVRKSPSLSISVRQTLLSECKFCKSSPGSVSWSLWSFMQLFQPTEPGNNVTGLLQNKTAQNRSTREEGGEDDIWFTPKWVCSHAVDSVGPPCRDGLGAAHPVCCQSYWPSWRDGPSEVLPSLGTHWSSGQGDTC